MSWQIHCVENTIKISPKMAKEIYEVQRYEDSEEGEFFYSEEDVTYDGYLAFNSDHCEHQDFLSTSEEIVEVLKKHKAKGVVVFQDVEQASDAYGDYWKHEFDGKGGYKFYRGIAHVTWTEDTNE